MKTMMKKIFTPLLFIAALFACEENVRIPDFKNAPNVRIVIAPENSYFDFSNLADAKLVYDLYSEDFNEIESVVIRFRYQKNGNPACNLYGCLGPFVVKTYTAEDLSSSKGQILDEEITIDDVLTAVGLTLADISGGDQFFFENITTMKDGRIYPTVTPNGTDNVPAIFDTPGAHFTASFAAIVGCPLSAAFTGSYSFTQISGPANWNPPPVGGIFSTGNVTLTAVNPITRSFTCTYLGFTGRTFTFILLCNNLIVPLQSSGVGCGGPQMAWQTDPVPGTYNPANHTTFDIRIIENPLLGCGEPASPVVLRLTKI